MKGAPAILEGFVAFEREVSVIAARGLDGSIVAYPIVENRHEHHILATTVAPAPVSPAIAAEAQQIAMALTGALEVVGLLAVEMFVTRDGRVLVNEMAPRPHNSGHWTIEGCPTSQFAQLVRAVAGLPLGPVTPFRPAQMRNLIGDQVHEWPRLIADPAAHLHLYGKAEARPGRKMGHVTRLKG
jgi:5-(carboxyamino)imidazole ribonucleotide synthase